MLTLAELQRASVANDGVPPFNDQAVIEAARGEREFIVVEDAAGREVGGALVLAATSAAGAEAEFAVLPDARGHGVGIRLAEMLAARFPGFEVWSHGELPAAIAIADRLGLQRIRTLLRMEAPLNAASGPAVPDPAVRSFGCADADAWLALNAAAFAAHPEQGSLTAADLADRRASEWHDDANLLLAERDGELTGYAWIKPDVDRSAEGRAELYALGVSPTHQGEGIGAMLLAAALERMRQLGADTAELYVEGENTAALRLYERFGFSRAAVDSRFRHQPFTAR